jgi:MATE family multidrug resistance protein
MHLIASWLFVYVFKLGVIGTAVTLSFSWWLLALGLLLYTLFGGCPLTWNGFSIDAFSGLWEFTKLSAASGVMIWYLLISLPSTHSYSIT